MIVTILIQNRHNKVILLGMASVTYASAPLDEGFPKEEGFSPATALPTVKRQPPLSCVMGLKTLPRCQYLLSRRNNVVAA